MASGFWRGFAETLNSNITKDRDAAREDASFERREKFRQELEKQYGAEVIARTAIEGNEEVLYNKYGDVIRRRPLSAEELKLRQAEMDTTLATARGKIADARRSELEADFAPRRMALDEAQTAASIRSANASADTAYGHLALDRAAAEREGNMPRDLREGIDKAQQTLYAVANTGVSSSAAEADVMEAKLEGAIANEDWAGARRIVNEIQGRYRRQVLEMEAAARDSGGFTRPTSTAIPGRD